MSATDKLALGITLTTFIALFATGQSQNTVGQNAKGDAAPRSVRVRVSESISQAFLTKKVQPQYPQEVRDKQVEGRVLLKAEISAEGDVTRVTLVSGDALLVPAATDAVKRWKYRPYLLNGRPIDIETQCTVDFRMQSPGKAAPPADPPPTVGVVGDVPGGVPGGETGGAIDGIISSTPVVKPRIAVPQRIRVSQGVSQGLLMTKVDPEYPMEARRGRIQGTVVLHIMISKTGDISTVELISGHPLLVPAAMEAVKQWKYKPFLLQGNPVEVDTEVLVNFVLSGN